MMTSDEARTAHPRLWAMIELAAGWAVMSWDGSGGPEEAGLPPVWCWENARGERGLIATPFESDRAKSIAAAMVRLEFEKHDAVRYVFTSETWMREISAEEADREVRDGLPLGRVRDHYDRREYVYHQAEDAGGGELSARQAVIRQGGQSRLGPLEPLGWRNSGGRMSRMLRPRTDEERINDVVSALRLGRQD